MKVLKRREFARWQASESLSDAALCVAIEEIESGLIDADLGGAIYKKRVARAGAGKSSGYRTFLAARLGHRYVFLHGFPKSGKANITQAERRHLRFLAASVLALPESKLIGVVNDGMLLEVCCGKQNH